MSTELLEEPFAQVDGEVLHIWCELCDSHPGRAVCGVDLGGHWQSDGGRLCPRCRQFWLTHACVLHPW